MVFPNSTNHYGTMFGGKVLDLMDRAAFLAATRFTEQSMVTASTERIDFFRPIKNGHLVELRAQVVYTGRTSLTVKVDLFAENPLRRYREQASQGFFNMVSVDEHGTPMRVPQLELETDDQRADWDHAKSLLEFRKKRRDSHPALS
jgi:acyl-CoA hydrolase